eukprot:7149015-Prymnesium_polylepis.1
MKARTKLDKKLKADKNKTDKFYSFYLCLRSEPVATFLGEGKPKSELPITSINEDRLLKELGISVSERNLIEGLSSRSRKFSSGIGVTDEQQTFRAVARLAANPTPEVRAMQRRTTNFLLRPYPLGLRFSGRNMSPAPCWLAGAQHVCLNFSEADTAVQLHFALFNGHGGFVLKPTEMRGVPLSNPSSSGLSIGESDEDEGQLGWPPPRKFMQRVTLHVISLHNLPKVCCCCARPHIARAQNNPFPQHTVVFGGQQWYLWWPCLQRGESRPCYSGSRHACHAYHPELSGSIKPPNSAASSRPRLTVQLHPIGGESSLFCSMTACQAQAGFSVRSHAGRATSLSCHPPRAQPLVQTVSQAFVRLAGRCLSTKASTLSSCYRPTTMV